MHRSESAWRDERPRVLVLACSDGRYEEALDEFCRESLRIEGYDRLLIPGGIQILRHALLPKFAWAGRRLLRFLLDKHGIRRLVLVAHEGCGWYRHMNWGPDAQIDPAERQRRDLLGVMQDLREDWPALEVTPYLARPEGGRVTFEAVASA